MNAFESLRENAARKRDIAIKKARAEYGETIQAIAELEAGLTGKPRKRPGRRKTSLTDLLYENLPDHRSFSTDEACGFIKAADSERTFSIATVRTILHRMLKGGLIKRVSDAGGTRTALFALPHVHCDDIGKTLVQWAMEILEANLNRPLTATEIMVRMQEAGYTLHASPAASVTYLGRELEKDPVFIQAGDQWRLVE